MKPIFTADDFNAMANYPPAMDIRAVAASIANAKLEKHLGPVVYTNNHHYWVDDIKYSNLTHRAYLFDVQEIEKECKHEGRITTAYVNNVPASSIINCKHCGAELEATWKVKGAK